MKTTKIISPYFENEAFAGVRVTLGDEDFVIASKDYQGGKEVTWPEAIDAIKTDGLDTWNYRQICYTMAYRKEVDKVLVDNGGDGLDNWYWLCDEYSAYYSFFYGGSNGTLDINRKRNTCSIRPIKNLKK